MLSNTLDSDRVVVERADSAKRRARFVVPEDHI
jgi:hypothetical protein